MNLPIGLLCMLRFGTKLTPPSAIFIQSFDLLLLTSRLYNNYWIWELQEPNSQCMVFPTSQSNDSLLHVHRHMLLSLREKVLFQELEPLI